MLPAQSQTLQMVKNLQQEMLQSKKDLKHINKCYIQLQAENQLMRIQLKTASSSARLKKGQTELKSAQSQINDLKKQLRKANKELDQLKQEKQNVSDKSTNQLAVAVEQSSDNHSAYGVSAIDCRRVLQNVSNIMYADTAE